MNAATDLAREDAQREYRRSQDWLDAHDALARLIDQSIGWAKRSSITIAVLDAIARGDIPGVRIVPRGDA